MKMNVIFSLALLGYLLSMNVGCSSKVEDGKDYWVKVVCTTSQIGDILRNVGGENVKVDVLMGPGVDPHDYSAKPQDRKNMNNSDMVFFNGLHLEGRMGSILSQENSKGPVMVQVSKKLEDAKDKRLRSTTEFGSHYDPHIWFDVTIWSDCVEYVTAQLIEKDPVHKETYRKNANNYLKELAELDQWIQKQVEQIPEKQRVLITAHDAFGYLGKRYGVNVKGVQGLSTADETSPQAIKKLADFIVENKVKAVFVENSVADRKMQSLIKECASLGHTVALGGKLYSDDMGDLDTKEGTYVGMYRYNIQTIVNALK